MRAVSSSDGLGSEEEVLADSVADMKALAQSASLLTASDSIMTKALDNMCPAGEDEFGCIVPTTATGRRSSSAAYRIRLRRLLMNTMLVGSVGAEISTSTSPRTLRSLGKLTSKPKEIQPESSADMMALLTSGTANVLADQLRMGTLATIVSLADSTVTSADYMASNAAAAKMLLGSKDCLQNIANVFVLSMTSDEVSGVSCVVVLWCAWLYGMYMRVVCV